ncbi:hypothetical protein THRCLA_00333 [Thraustotheca clavata]|uniref:Secreted protein n=1 Tax=Thraustotheca clavata TaxID=74557 RepID=A0A1W0ABV9_9STRA|nr:hypothetical protein THRCLA_00333 [Thraustotheca clavata]
MQASTIEAIALLVTSFLVFLRSVKRSKNPPQLHGLTPEMIESIALFIPCPTSCLQFMQAMPQDALSYPLQCLLKLLDPKNQNVIIQWPTIYLNKKDRTQEVLQWIQGARLAHHQLALDCTNCQRKASDTLFSDRFLPSYLHVFDWQSKRYSFHTLGEQVNTPEAIIVAHTTPQELESMALNLPEVCFTGLVTLLPTMVQLKELTLQNYNFEPNHDINALLQALCWLPHLKRLHLTNNHLDDTMAYKIARIVRCCPELDDLDCSSNQLSAKGVDIILNALLKNTHVKSVNLTQNPYMLKELVESAPVIAKLAATVKTIFLRVDRDDMSDAFPFLRALRNCARHRIVVMMVGSGTLSSELSKEYDQLRHDLRRGDEKQQTRCQLYLFGRDPWPKRDLIVQNAGCAVS